MFDFSYDFGNGFIVKIIEINHQISLFIKILKGMFKLLLLGLKIPQIGAMGLKLIKYLLINLDFHVDLCKEF